MEYRVLGRTGLKVSGIGLGTEYLIEQPRDHVINVIREALARGINYFDLFFAQPRFRDVMGEAFQGHRDRVILTTHLGAAERDGQYEKTRNPAECRKFFLDFLDRYRTDHTDVLFLHNCDSQEDYERVMGPGGLLDMARGFQREGKARFIGFSGHTVSTSLAAVKTGAVDVLMFTLNVMGNAVPGRNELLAECARRGVGVVAMKPFAGGKLFQAEGEIELSMYHTGGVEKKLEGRKPITPVQCISYVLSQIGVSTVVPGCKDLEQLSASLAYLSAAEAEKDYSAAVSAFKEYLPGQCVYCNHCLPCPSHIDVGRVMRMLDTASHPPSESERAAYRSLPAAASDCIQCGDCEGRCPFGVKVVSRMEEAAARFG